MTEIPKYAALEIERRWLVDLVAVGDLSAVPYREIEDLYIDGTRLRLRRMTERGRRTVFKLGKKYGKVSLAEPMTNLYLTQGEYEQLRDLPGRRTSKRRYSLSGGALDIYHAPRQGMAVFEIEFGDETTAQTYEPPPFVTREITAESSYSGVSLAEAH
jgi:CYTH domain-containing protein